MYIKKYMNPNPVEIDEYKHFLLIFSEYENHKDKKFTVKAIGNNQYFKNYIYLTGTKDNSEKTFQSIKEARDAIQKEIDQKIS